MVPPVRRSAPLSPTMRLKSTRNRRFTGYPTRALNSISTNNAGNYSVIITNLYGSVSRVVAHCHRKQDSGKDWNLRAIKNSRCSFRSEEHTSELQSLTNLVCRLLLEKK